VLGGNDYGNLTLTHFYALHALVLPALLTMGVLAHIVQVRRHGVANPKGVTVSEPFWPRQAVRDTLATVLVMAGLLLWVVRAHGVDLEAPADPSSSYEARPEWYFLPLFQLLKMVPAQLELVVALGVPLVVGAALFALPLVKASPRGAGALVLLVLVGAVALGGEAALEDRDNEGYKLGRERAHAEALRARKAAARQGVPPAGGLALLTNDPLARTHALFQQRCAGCHVLDGSGDGKGPLLTGWSTRAWLTDFLQNPEAPRYFGRTRKLHQMKPVKAGGADLDALVEYMWALGGGEVHKGKMQRGETVFRREHCDDCHATDGKAEGDGAPNLGGRGSAAWIETMIRDPGHPALFGDHNEMPRFGRDKLADAEVQSLVQLLAEERLRSDVSAASLARQP
jgi:ubiquinol-cytochrome c reductase cytochrome b subunit